jgi:hypothetical protein
MSAQAANSLARQNSSYQAPKRCHMRFVSTSEFVVSGTYATPHALPVERLHKLFFSALLSILNLATES